MQFLGPRGSFSLYPGFPHTSQSSSCGREDTCGRDFLFLFRYASLYIQKKMKKRVLKRPHVRINQEFSDTGGDGVIPGERERSV